MATEKADLKERFANEETPYGTDFAKLIDEIRTSVPTTTSSPLLVDADIAAVNTTWRRQHTHDRLLVDADITTVNTSATGLVSPANAKAQVDNCLATRGEAQVDTEPTKLMSPLRTQASVNAQTPSFRDATTP